MGRIGKPVQSSRDAREPQVRQPKPPLPPLVAFSRLITSLPRAPKTGGRMVCCPGAVQSCPG
ncbi:predicted protein [Plenodomus lingam JN3]|uniref:Uncharacterized protein n=1 Tax=Leptosphaeria maculans (strain JN3 / isolate v23.1.3 / race Av1-4-5-6-7-8) TaxID=985895 RepID=E4ZG30_LEPMJ|nr:predicted protein [Plenodomus lingam JN3]CBX90250.1 predicted protein [Plenodomus lingam JN3]